LALVALLVKSVLFLNLIALPRLAAAAGNRVQAQAYRMARQAGAVLAQALRAA
jgi:hypothetical protein